MFLKVEEILFQTQIHIIINEKFKISNKYYKILTFTFKSNSHQYQHLYINWDGKRIGNTIMINKNYARKCETT